MKQNEQKLNEAGSLTSLLTATEAALRLKVSRGTIYNMIHQGRLVPDGWLSGCFPRFKIETVDAMVENKIRERAPRKRKTAHGA